MARGKGLMGVILAGGRGSRMYPFNEHYPKCILPICNKPIMEYQIEMMVEMGITDIVIVIGYYGFDVVGAIGNGERHGANIRYVDQGETLGIAHALGKIESVVERPFLLFLGDIFFDTDSLMPMFDAFEAGNASAVLATKHEPDPLAIQRNFAVLEGADGCVKRVIEKPRNSVTGLKGCGLYMFDLHVFDAVRRTPRTAMRDEYELTDTIQILIDDGFCVKHVSVVKDDLNLTFPQDLLKINLIELKRRGGESVIGENTDIASPHLIESAVIGSSVSIPEGVTVRNSMIFPATVLEAGMVVENTILTPETRIYCQSEELA